MVLNQTYFFNPASKMKGMRSHSNCCAALITAFRSVSKLLGWAVRHTNQKTKKIIKKKHGKQIKLRMLSELWNCDGFSGKPLKKQYYMEKPINCEFVKQWWAKWCFVTSILWKMTAFPRNQSQFPDWSKLFDVILFLFFLSLCFAPPGPRSW